MAANRTPPSKPPGTPSGTPAAASSADQSLFEQLGGEPVLRAIIDCFVDRVMADTMIGFFFSRVSPERLKAKEYEFAAQHLGADVEYTGRPIDSAHQRHPIMGGQFMRRLQVLKNTLEDFQVPEHIRDHWVRHTLALQPLVTRDTGGRCDPHAALERTRFRS